MHSALILKSMIQNLLKNNIENPFSHIVSILDDSIKQYDEESRLTAIYKDVMSQDFEEYYPEG